MSNKMESCWYDDFFEWTEEDVRPYFEEAEQLIHKIEGLIRSEE